MPDKAQIERALGLLPSVACVMTAAFEGRRSGLLVHWLMQCSKEPPCVCVAPHKGHPIAPLIRDSHSFGLCLVDRSERLLLRKFGDVDPEDADPFDSFPVQMLQTGSPLLESAVAVMDCEVVRHFDLEAEHEIYVGEILDARDRTG